jgi:hypothetical protein
MPLTLSQLQAKGWVSQTQQLSHGIGWGYRILRKDGQFSSSIYSKEELEDEQNQINLFAQFQEQ